MSKIFRVFQNNLQDALTKMQEQDNKDNSENIKKVFEAWFETLPKWTKEEIENEQDASNED